MGWTEEEDRRLEELSRTVTSRRAAELLGKKQATVVKRATKLGCPFTRRVGGGTATGAEVRGWTDAEDKVLWMLAAHHPVRHIAEKVGRTQNAVRQRARKLGISLQKGQVSMELLRELFGVSYEVLARHRKLLGQEWRTRKPAFKYGKRLRNVKGPTEDEIRALAESMLKDTTLNVKASRLRAIIQGELVPDTMDDRFKEKP